MSMQVGGLRPDAPKGQKAKAQGTLEITGAPCTEVLELDGEDEAMMDESTETVTHVAAQSVWFGIRAMSS